MPLGFASRNLPNRVVDPQKWCFQVRSRLQMDAQSARGWDKMFLCVCECLRALAGRLGMIWDSFHKEKASKSIEIPPNPPKSLQILGIRGKWGNCSKVTIFQVLSPPCAFFSFLDHPAWFYHCKHDS